MKKHFEEQLKNLKPISEETINLLTGKSFYSEYQVGDHVCLFANIQPQATKSTDPKMENVTISMHTVVERDFERLDEEFLYVRHNGTTPFLIKKGMEKDYIFKGKILL